MLIQGSLGILNNIFITGTLGFVAFGLAWTIWHYIKIYNQANQFKLYAYHWLGLSIMWLLLSGSLFLGWLELESISRIVFYSALMMFIASSGLVLAFLVQNLITSKKLVYGIIASLGIIITGSLFLGGVTYDGLTIWDSRYFLSGIFLMAYAVLYLVPIVLTSVYVFVITIMQKTETQGRDWLRYAPLLIALYMGLIVVDYASFITGLIGVWLRLGLLAFVFIVFFVLLNKRLNTHNIEDDFKLRTKLIVQAILYSMLTTILPLIVAAILLSYSFDAIVSSGKFASLQNMYDVKQQITMTAIIVGVVSFFVSLVAIRAIENRIKSIIQGMYDVLDSNFATRIRDAGPHDELGSLGLAFNDMAEDLSNYDSEIAHYEKLLEQKVEQRTQELEKKTKQAEKLVEELKLSSERLQSRTGTITNQMKDGLLVLDYENNILRFNNSFLEFFNLKENNVTGKNLKDLSFIADYQDFLFMINRVQEERVDTTQQKLQLKPPLKGLLQCQVSQFDLGDGQQGTIVMMRDIAPPWGVVYDSENIEPVEGVVARLYNEANNKIIAEETTDEVGRFMFYVDPGSYYLRLFKDGYHFPSKKPDGYHGEVINVENRNDGIVHYDVLIDKI